MATAPRLAARCPNCHTAFRVVADQLRLRGGLVRCGRCNHVFDGRNPLIELGAAPAPAAQPEPPPLAQERVADAEPARVAATDPAAPPTETPAASASAEHD
ncbi:MAG: MJ0042-type zinc finger domain-containing protein, partial [Ralstonia mannitolilytica]